jgi:RNA polymerase sigma-70 factor, ECF subfamily
VIGGDRGVTDDERSDRELLAAYVDARDRAGRDAAFLTLVERYERRIYGICLRYFGDHDDAADATQDTFLNLARRADSFRGDAALSTFVYRMATNACHDLARRRARRPQTPVADVAELARDAGPDEHAGTELRGEVERALLQLDELSRTLLLLVSVEGLSYAEASAVTDLPVGTIKSRVCRARAQLAELLAPVLRSEDPAGWSGDTDTASASGPDPATPPRGPPTAAD